MNPLSTHAAYLFDLDGTLVHTAPDIALALNETLIADGLGKVTPEQVTTWIGTGSRRLVAHALNALDVPATDQRVADLLAAFAARYEAVPVRESTLYPHARQTLATLHSQGKSLGVVTNKISAVARRVLAHFDLDSLLHVVIGGDDVKPNKPDPAPLVAACDQLRLAPSQVLMVGDSVNDVRAARAAGMAVVALPYGYNHGNPIAAANPDQVIETMAELL